MVPLTSLRRPQRSLRRRDFAPIRHEAPVAVRRLSQAYHQTPPSPWRFWRLIIVLLMLIGGLAAAAYAPLFTIRNIIINDVPSRPTEERLRQIVSQVAAQRPLYILPASNLLFFSTTQARQAIAQEFYTEELSFVRHWPNVVKVNFSSNIIVGSWQAGGSYFLLDRRGTLVQQLESDSSETTLITVVEQDPPERNLGDHVTTEEVADFLGRLNQGWQAQLDDVPLDYVQFSPQSLPTIQVFTAGGWYVNLSTQADLGAQLVNLRRLLDEKIKQDQAKLQYIDVRFGSRLFYKLK